jgi:hypothetical protein
MLFKSKRAPGSGDRTTSIKRPNLTGIVTGVVLALILTQGVAYGAALITSADIKDGAVTSADLKNDTVATKDLSTATVDALDPFQGEHWSVVDRNVIGSGESFLRAGPSVLADGPRGTPPMGQGSLGILTGTGADKSAFGNQVKFVGDLVSGLTAVGFWVFTTGENIGQQPGTANMPSLTFEIDPNLATAPDDNFSSMVFSPGSNTAPSVWRHLDATNDANGAVWGLTGGNMPCDINGARCTWTDLQTALADGGEGAQILTVQLTKGRDFAFSGAVDALQINTKVYDFEPTGVIITTAP